MKLEDIEVGQTVVDKFGNEYKVVDKLGNEYIITAFDKPNYHPVKLKCTKFKRECIVDVAIVFTDVDDEWWIIDDEVAHKEFANYDVDISLKSIKPKESK